MSKGRVIVVEQELLKSKAWFSLSGAAPAMYTLFLTKRRYEKAGTRNNKQKVLVNGREITFYYREAQKNYGITQSRFTRAIDQLVDRGFIDIVEPGNGTARIGTKYGISERWRKYGTPEFVVHRREPVKRGFCKTHDQHKNSM